MHASKRLSLGNTECILFEKRIINNYMIIYIYIFFFTHVCGEGGALAPSIGQPPLVHDLATQLTQHAPFGQYRLNLQSPTTNDTCVDSFTHRVSRSNKKQCEEVYIRGEQDVKAR